MDRYTQFCDVRHSSQSLATKIPLRHQHAVQPRSNEQFPTAMPLPDTGKMVVLGERLSRQLRHPAAIVDHRTFKRNEGFGVARSERAKGCNGAVA